MEASLPKSNTSSPLHKLTNVWGQEQGPISFPRYMFFALCVILFNMRCFFNWFIIFSAIRFHSVDPIPGSFFPVLDPPSMIFDKWFLVFWAAGRNWIFFCFEGLLERAKKMGGNGSDNGRQGKLFFSNCVHIWHFWAVFLVRFFFGPRSNAARANSSGGIPLGEGRFSQQCFPNQQISSLQAGPPDVVKLFLCVLGDDAPTL